jgi:hypothetical protein
MEPEERTEPEKNINGCLLQQISGMDAVALLPFAKVWMIFRLQNM